MYNYIYSSVLACMHAIQYIHIHECMHEWELAFHTQEWPHSMRICTIYSKI